jgi:diguanylate cyclase (GGDEF)-like protein
VFLTQVVRYGSSAQTTRKLAGFVTFDRISLGACLFGLARLVGRYHGFRKPLIVALDGRLVMGSLAPPPYRAPMTRPLLRTSSDVACLALLTAGFVRGCGQHDSGVLSNPSARVESQQTKMSRIFPLAAHARYPARKRREVRLTVQAGTATFALAMLANLGWLGAQIPGLRPHYAASAAGALVCLLLIRGPLVRRPEVVGLLLTCVVVTSTLAPLSVAPDLFASTLGIFGLTVVGAGMFLPWSFQTHLMSIGAMAIGWVGFVLSPWWRQVEAAYPSAARELVILALPALGASLVGFVVVDRRRLGAYQAELRARALSLRTRKQQLDLARLNDELHASVRLDSLTGTSNRHGLAADAPLFFASRPHSIDGGVCLRAAILVDVDHFKRYNDRHGHLTGDTALRAVGQALQGLPNGTTYRFGGEEFLLLADFEDMDVLELAVDRLRERSRCLESRMSTMLPGADSRSALGLQHPRRGRGSTAMP